MRMVPCSDGFTVIELMITLALLSLVVIGGVQLYTLTDRAFMAGSHQADLQTEMHLAMYRITEEVRLAHSLTIGPSKEKLSGHEGQQEYKEEELWFIYSDGGSVFLETSAGRRVLLDANLLGTDYELSFAPVDISGQPSTSLLGITLKSRSSESHYELSSTIQILNLRANGIFGDEGKAICFAKTISERELEQAETLKPGCVIKRYVYEPNAPEVYALRTFRDNRLASSLLGRFAVEAYYAVSPVIVAYLELHPWAQDPVRKIIDEVAQLALRFS